MSYMKSDALGDAGTAATEVVTVQGIAGGTAVPISGTVTASGDHTVVGKAADGAAVSGNPVLIAGQDGTNAQSISTDSTGRQVVVGGGADGAAVAGNPVLIAGSDGANARTITTDSSGRVLVGGAVASGSADTGNPVKIAGKYNATLPTFADGQRTDLQTGSRGSLNVQILGASSTTGASVIGTSSDALATSVGAIGAASLNYSFNGTTWDRQRSDGTTGGQGVGGTVASATTDSGNPVKVGAKFNSSLPTFTDGQRGDLQINSRGALRTELFSAASAGAAIISTTSDAMSNSNISLYVAAHNAAFNGTSWERLRTANVFKTVTATASGDTAVWTPAAGKKFRLLGYTIEVTGEAATAGGARIEIVLRDNTTAIGCGSSVYVPNAGGTVMGAEYNSGQRTIGNGKLSAVADQILNVNLSAALSAGVVRVNAWGTEE